MSTLKLIFRTLFHYRWLNLAVLVGVALTSAILSGALVVGDSVKESLRRNAESRISNAGLVLVGGDRFFTEALADRVRESLPGDRAKPMVAPILQVQGTVSTQGSGKRLNKVQVIGVTDDFWKLSRSGERPADLKDSNWIAINQPLANRLEIGTKDRIVVRVEVPGALSRDAPLSGETEQTAAKAGGVDVVIDADHFGRYSLRAEQIPPATVFLPIITLQNALEKPGAANVLLGEQKAGLRLDDLETAVEKNWSLADAGLHLAADLDDAELTENLLADTGLRSSQNSGLRQMNSDRVFIEPEITEAAREVAGTSDSVLSYLVNAFRFGEKMTPYSFVAGATSDLNDLLPDDLKNDELVVNQWLADDLGVKPGDRLTMEYFVFGEGRKLVEESRNFTVRAVLPMNSPGWDRTWTPHFPGISDVDSLDLWEPGIPIDKERILPKDDDYWDQYEATPKAFVTLTAAQDMWKNRFGNATSIRLAPDGIPDAEFEAGMKERLNMSDLAFTVRDLQAEAGAAVGQSFDFGALFASMSFFLIVAALILTGLVFVFGIEQRAGQIGLLMALGMPAKKVRRLFLVEALILAVIGAAIGLIGGWIYTKLALLGMSGAWQAAAAGIQFVYHVRPASLGIAFGATVFLALLVVFFSSRLVTKVQPSHLIAGGDAIGETKRGPKTLMRTWSFWIGIVSILAGLGCLFAPKEPGTMAEQGMFFGAGFLITIAGVCACALGLRMLERPGESLTSLGSLGRQNAVRRKGRSLAVIGLMASGVFMVTAINSFRLEGERGAERRGSGTGGFAFVGDSTLAIYEDLNSELARKKYDLGPVADPDSWEMIQFRVSNGEDASCLNLNRAQRPRLMGVDWTVLTNGTDPFSFMKSFGGETYERWFGLSHRFEPGDDGIPVIPGIIDMNTATYALQKGLGDVIEYESASGDRFDVKLVGLLETSILQGNIIIAEDEFIRHFPDAGGYRYFLLDGPKEETGKVSQHLTRMLGDRGLQMLPAWERLNEFNAVQNTYLSIFSTLGGLGLLLGTIGLAVVVSRNVLERKGQLGLMQAVGFTRESLGRMVLSEHWFLHVLGVLLGVLAAVIAVAPKVLSRASDLPIDMLMGINSAILVGGLIFCWIAARSVLRGSLMDALRSE